MPDGAPAPGWPGPWRDGNYLRYRAARFTSVLGSRLSGIAYPLLVLHMTGSPAKAGLLGSVWVIAQAGFRLPAGHLTDRFDRRAVMIAMDVLRLAAVGSIPLAAWQWRLTFYQLLVVAVIEGAATAPFESATMALLREVVPEGGLMAAISQGRGLGAAATLAGPVLGGLAYSVNPMLPFIADAGSYGASALLLLTVRSRYGGAAGAGAAGVTAGVAAGGAAGGGQQVTAGGGTGGGQPTASADRRATAGFRWLRGQPVMLRVLTFAAVINLVSCAAPVAAVIVLREHGTSADVIGGMLACVGGGALAGAVLARRVLSRLDPLRLCLIVGGSWVAGLCVFTVAGQPWVLGPAFAVMFLLTPAAGIVLSTMTLSQTPPELLGRVIAAEQLVTSALIMIVPAATGLELQFLGARWLWVALACGSLGAAAIAAGPAWRSWQRGRQPEPEPVGAAATSQ